MYHQTEMKNAPSHTDEDERTDIKFSQAMVSHKACYLFINIFKCSFPRQITKSVYFKKLH